MRYQGQEISQAVLKVNTASGSGSSFFVPEFNVAVTNYHVVGNNREVALEDLNQNRYLARVINANPISDLAILQVVDPLPELPPLSLAEVDSLSNRDQVYVMGYPFGMPFTITEGIVSSTRQLLEGRYYIQTDAAVNPGNSGGPVLNTKGQVVGVTTAKFTHADNVGFAIPIDTLLAELEGMTENPGLDFAIRCPSCRYLMFKQASYCPNCGNEMEESWFEAPELSGLAGFVEGAITDLGINPVLTRAGHDYWLFHQGSSQVRMFVYDQSYLYATSPLNQLPASGLTDLYTYLLSDPVPPYSLGIHEHQIYLSYRISIAGVFTSQREVIKKELAGMARTADELDDYLSTRFGCPMTPYARENLPENGA